MDNQAAKSGVNHLREGLRAHFSEARLLALRKARVGIAGAGGLGSNVAMMLARSGIEHFTIIDDDVVEASNLNRQHYWPSQMGLKKVDALAAHLRMLNPEINLDLRHGRLGGKNLREIIPACPIWVEALDGAKDKSDFVEAALLLGRFTVAATGMGGFGGEPMRARRLGSLVVVGDFKTPASDKAPPLAPRVVQAAAMMADAVLEHILLPTRTNLEDKCQCPKI